MATLTRNLKLRLSDDLSTDSRYNLERIDQLGSTFNINTLNNTVVRAAGNIQMRPEDNSSGGSGSGGTVEFGDSSQRLDAAIINGPLKLLSTLNSTNYLTLLNAGTGNVSLTINTGAANRLLTLGGDLVTSGGNIGLVASGNQIINLPITNAEVASAAAIAGSKISPVFGNQLVSTQQGYRIINGSYTTTLLPATSQGSNVSLRLPATDGIPNSVLTTDGNGNLSFNNIAGSGTVTSVGLSMPNIFDVTGSPVTVSGILTADLALQAANKVLAGPSSGSNAIPTFRQLSSDELTAGSTNKFYTSTLFNNDLATKTTTNLAEGTNLYHTTLRAQDAVGAIVADTATAEMDYVSGTTLSVTVKPAGFINSSGGLTESLGILRVDPTQATSKASPIGTDSLLIADSADSNNLKKVTLSAILTLSGNGYSTTWTSGTIKSVTHNLNSRDVLVEVYDNTTYETVILDSVVRTDVNTITLTASSAPSGAGLTVLVKRI
jgi:hypothetical protein